jgi:hypothetical protein
MSTKIEIKTPVGRLVQGSVSDPQTKDLDGSPLVYKTGPNKGSPRSQFYLALAVPKTDPTVQEFINKITAFARQIHPRFFDQSGSCVLPTYSFKIVDGDSTSVDKKGRAPCQREGFKGNWIFRFNSDFPIKCFSVENSVVTPIDPKIIKAGHYIRIAGVLADNNSEPQPGVKLFASMVQFVGYGPEIEYGPDARIFADSPAALPPGASKTPIPSGNMPNMPPAPANAPAAFMGSLPAGVRPAHDFLKPPAGLQQSPAVIPPPPPGAPLPASMVPPPPPVKYMVDGHTYTADELKKFGWNDAQIAACPRA